MTITVKVLERDYLISTFGSAISKKFKLPRDTLVMLVAEQNLWLKTTSTLMPTYKKKYKISLTIGMKQSKKGIIYKR